MNGSSVGGLIVRLLLERDKFRADLRETVNDAEAGANRVTRAAGAITEAVTDAAQGQANVASLAARALGVLGPAAGVAVAGAIAVGVAYHQAGKETEAYHRSIVLTGNAAGVTAGQLADMARNIDGVVGTQGQAAATLAQMTASAKVARENLELVSIAAQEMERTSVQAIGESVKIFTDLGKDPVKASARLNESLNYLTASTFEQIKAAEELGRTEEAAAIAQNAYAEAMRERTAKVEENLGYLQRFMRGVRETAAEMWDAILNVGRDKGPAAMIAAQERTVAALETQLARGGTATAGIQAQLDSARQRLQTLQDEAKASAAAAEAQRQKSAAESAGIALSVEASKHDSALEKQRKAVAQATELYTAARKKEGLTTQELAQLDANYLKIVTDLTQAREKQARTGKGKDGGGDPYAAERAGAQEWAKVMLTAGKAVEDVEAKTQKLNAAEAALQAYLASPAYQQNSEEMRQMAVNRLKAWDAALKHASAVEEEGKAIAGASKAMSTWHDSRAKETAALTAQMAARREEVATLGLTATEVAALTAAKYEQAAAEKEAYAAALESAKLYAGEYSDAYRAAAEEARQQANLLRELAGTEVFTAGQRAMLDEWKQTVSQYDQVFQRGFVDMVNAGKDGWKSFTRSLATTFKTTVADQLYKAFAQPFVVNVIGKMLGLTGLGTAGSAVAGAGQSVLSSIGSIGSGYSLLAGLGGAFGGGVAGGFGGLMGTLGLSSAGSTLGGALSAGSIALQSGNILGGLGTFVGALGPIAVGLGALAALLGKDDSGTPHTGALAEYSAASGLQTSQTHGAYGMGFGGVDASDETRKAVGSVAQAMGKTLDSVAESFGRAARFTVATAFADDSSKDGAWGGLRIALGDEELVNWNRDRDGRWAPREYADGKEGQAQYQADLALGLRDALQQVVPEWGDTYLAALGDSLSIDQLQQAVTTINQLQSAWVSLGDAIPYLADMSEAAVNALAKAAGGMEALVGGVSAYFQNYYSAEEQRSFAIGSIGDKLRTAGVQVSDEWLSDATRQQFRELAEAQDRSTDSGRSAYAALMSVAQAFANVTAAAEGAAAAAEAEAQVRKQQLQGLYEQLERAVSAERAALDAEIELRQERVSAAGEVVAATREQMLALRGQVASTSALSASQGNAFIERALSAVRSTGYLPNAGELTEAANAARSGIDAGSFSSRKDFEAANLILANKLEGLHDKASEQLTNEEQMLEVARQARDELDSLLKLSKQQLDAALNSNAAIADVATAVREFRAALLGDEDKGTAGGNVGNAGGAFVIGGGGGGFGGMSPEEQAESKAQNIRDYVGLVYKDNSNYADPHALAQISASAYLSNWSLAEMSKALSIPAHDIVNMMEGAGLTHWREQLPGFAVGTNYVTEDMVAEIHRGEAILPQPFNPWAGGVSPFGDGGTVEAIERLASQQYDLLRMVVVRLDSIDTLTRKGDALGVKQRVAA